MKKTIITLAVLLSTITAAISQNTGREIKAYLRQEGFSISTEQYANLSEGETARYFKNFYSGTDYAIIAYSEESGVQDIDVYLYDDDGSLIVKDTDTKDIAIITYSPYVTRQMKVVIKNYNSTSSYHEYDCKFIIAYK